MKRAAIGALWLATIVATWQIVGRATNQNIPPPTPPPSAEVRGAVRGAARAAPLPTLRELPAPVDDRMFREALAVLHRDLADGRWGAADRDRLNAAVLRLDVPHMHQLYDVLLPKLNAGTVKSELDGPPI